MEIMHHLGCKKFENNERNYLSTGAGFLPSTVLITLLDELCFSFSNQKPYSLAASSHDM